MDSIYWLYKKVYNFLLSERKKIKFNKPVKSSVDTVYAVCSSQSMQNGNIDELKF